MIKVDDLHSRIIGDETLSLVRSLAGASLAPAMSQLLISLPNQGDWTTQGLSWHTDVSPSASPHGAGIQAFVLVDGVNPRGGATLAMAGSHRLAAREEAHRTVRALLRTSKDLEGELRSLGFSIVEMSGNAGDLYLMDMRLLHTPSFNATSKLRMMATVRYLADAHRPTK